jgi:hypothetical protein
MYRSQSALRFVHIDFSDTCIQQQVRRSAAAKLPFECAPSTVFILLFLVLISESQT